MKIQKRILLLLMAALIMMLSAACGKNTSGNEVEAPITGTIERTVEDTGLVIFDDNYSVTAIVNAKVLTADFHEGDTVSKGQVLYTLDSKEIKDQISQTTISLSKANEAYRQSVNAVNDLTVKSYAGGMITKVYCHVGDYVSPGGKIADVVDSETLMLQVPFQVSNQTGIYPGSAAEVIMSSDGSIIPGKITKLFDAPQALSDRQFGITAEIEITNPGALKQGDAAYARIGEFASVTSGTLKNKTEQAISATQSGQVTTLNISEGSKVSAGQAVLKIKNDSLNNAVNTASINVKEIQNTLSQLNSKLADYQIVSPVDGVVIQKTAKDSDLATPGTPLAVLADNGNLYIEMDVDELYINEVAIGQAVTAAVQGTGEMTYSGRVTQISDSGTAKNGVTYYKVKISLDNQEGLLEAMNMDVKIVTASKENVMMIPIRALKGNTVSVWNGKKAVEKEVTVGIKNKQYAEIVSGLSADDQILIGGTTK